MGKGIGKQVYRRRPIYGFRKDAGKQSAVKLVPLLTVAVGLIIWFIPAPSGLEPKAWHLFAIFVATIIGFISKPLPMGAIAILHWRLLH